MTTPQPIPYAQDSSAELNAAAKHVCHVQVIPPQGHPREVAISGCPACSHQTLFEYPLDVIEAEVLPTKSRRADSRRRPWVVTVVCQCTVPHPGAPEGAVGCGRYWSLVVGGF